MKIFHLAFECILIIWSHVRGLDSSVNIMDHVLITDMLVIDRSKYCVQYGALLHVQVHAQTASNYTVGKLYCSQM